MLEGLSAEALADRLVAIYRQHPEGFASKWGGPAEAEIRRIGEFMYRDGGKQLMLKIHTIFSDRCQLRGAARNLEHMWDGIGEWLG